MSNLQLLISGIVLMALELSYFVVARRFAIVDRPNARTLHVNPTIRGGGVIFFFATWIYYFFSTSVSLLFMGGLSLVSVVGFLDDVFHLKSSVRLIIQIFALTLLFYDLDGMNYFGIAGMILLIFIATAALNAFNFMDGINGITVGYSLTILSALVYVNNYYEFFIDNDLLIMLAIALLIFAFFNFRTRALCFAGDVGSTSIAYILIGITMSLITMTGNFVFILFLSIYGIDSAFTIAHRLIKKEDIFKPHRFHLYQVIVYHYRIPHLAMSLTYMATQLVVSWIVIARLDRPLRDQYLMGAAILVALSIIYVLLRSLLLIRPRVRQNN